MGNLWDMIRKMLQNRENMRRLRRMVTVLAAVVVFITTYALMLPAVTINREAASEEPGFIMESLEITGKKRSAKKSGKKDETRESKSAKEIKEESKKAAKESRKAAEEESKKAEKESRKASEEESKKAAEKESRKAAKESKKAKEASRKAEESKKAAKESRKAAEESEKVKEEAKRTGKSADEGGFEAASGKAVCEGDDYTVTVKFDKKAGLPKDVKLDVKEIRNSKKQKDTYADYQKKALKALKGFEDEELKEARFFELVFLYDGEEIEPKTAVTVVFEWDKKLNLEKDEHTEAVFFNAKKKADRLKGSNKKVTAEKKEVSALGLLILHAPEEKKEPETEEEETSEGIAEEETTVIEETSVEEEITIIDNTSEAGETKAEETFGEETADVKENTDAKETSAEETSEAEETAEEETSDEEGAVIEETPGAEETSETEETVEEESSDEEETTVKETEGAEETTGEESEEASEEETEETYEEESAEEETETGESEETSEEESTKETTAEEENTTEVATTEEETTGEESEETTTDEEETTGEKTGDEDETTGEEAEETEQGILVFEGRDYSVTVRFDEENGIPEDAVLSVRELPETSGEYKSYIQDAEESTGDDAEVTYARLFDIAVKADDEIVESAGDVNITVTLKNAVQDERDLHVLHFAEGEITELDADVNEGSGSSGLSEDKISFVTDEFAIEGIFGTETITKEVLSSDGHNYRITVTYGPEAGIPAGAELLVSEIAEDSDDYEDYISRTESALDSFERVTFSRFFDISIVADGREIQPLVPVDVKIKLTDELTEDVKAVHFGEEVDMIDANLETGEEGNSVVFSADGFSVYGVVMTETITAEFLSHNGTKYEIIVTYGPDANIPEGSVLSVKDIEEGTEKYAYARNAVLADKKEKGESVDIEDFYLAALDISILNPAGEEIEPEAPVQVDMKIKSLPGVGDLLDVQDSLAVQHHIETEEGVIVDTVFDGSAEASFEQHTDEEIIAEKGDQAVDPEDVSDEDFINKPKEESGIDAKFTTPYFSTYTVTWRQNSSNRSATVHYGYMNGSTFVEFADGIPSYTPSFNDNYAFLIYDVDGYAYDSTHLNSAAGTAIQPLLNVSGNNHQYTTGSTDWWGNLQWNDFNNGSDIYVVYKEKPAPAQGGTVTPVTEETWPDGEDAPQFSKSSINSGDGTNEITLEIKAAEKPVENSTKANVIVVLDVSASMSDYMGNQTRMARARTAVNNLADTLLGKVDSNGNKLVKMALVTFGGTANLVRDYTDNASTFKNSVPTSPNASNSYLGATNWEQALYIANRLENADADAATYIVFVTDGDPTFRMSRGEYTDAQLESEQANRTTFQPYREDALYGYGAGTLNSNNNIRNFDAAVTEAASIIDSNKNLYAIGVSSDVTAVQNLVTQAGGAAENAILATNSEELTEAFDKIASSISAALGFGNIEITDGITALTNAEMKVMQTVDPNSFRYYRYGGEGNKYGADADHKTEWTTRESDGCAAASYSETDGAVHWDMGENFQLEDGVTYVVTFRVWPSQAAYDLIADLNNEIKTYDTLSEAEKAQVKVNGVDPETGKTKYALKTNTEEVNATYNKTTKSGDVVSISDTQDIEATYHEGTIQNMALTSMKLTIKKEFEDDLTVAEDRETVVTLVLKRRNAHQNPEEEFADYAVPQGGTTSANIVLNEANNWTYEFYVAPGLEAEGEVLEHGYDFTITEPGIDYHYMLIEEIVNPMVVDGEDRYYGDGYLIDDEETVQQYIDRSLTAVNRVKSGIDIRKKVYDVDGTTEIYPDTEFTITGKLLGPDGQPYTWSSGDNVNASGAYHKFDRNGNKIIEKGHFADSSDISFTLKAGEYVRFINVPQGCTFEFTESTAGMDALGYEWKSTEAVTQHRVSADSDEYTTEGDVQPDVSGQTASLKGEKHVIGNKQYMVTYGNKRTMPLPTVELVKADAQDHSKINGAEFTLYSDAELTKPVTIDGNGDAIAIRTDNKEGSEGPDGWYHIGLLPAGTYYLVETSAPDNYVLDETPVIITVTKGTDSYTVTAVKNGESVISGPVDGLYTITVDNERLNQLVKFRKVDATDSNAETNGLKDAEFTLAVGDTIYNLKSDANGDMYALVGEVGSQESQYVFEIPALLATPGTPYIMTETNPPAGYNSITGHVQLYVYTNSVMADNSEDNLISYDVTSEEKDGITIYTVTIPNNPGVVLPATGGIGTLVFRLFGILLIAGAGIILLLRRRRLVW